MHDFFPLYLMMMMTMMIMILDDVFWTYMCQVISIPTYTLCLEKFVNFANEKIGIYRGSIVC